MRSIQFPASSGGRGGSTVSIVNGLAIAFGGADRNGTLFSDVLSVDAARGRIDAVTPAEGSTAVEPLGGHAAATVSLDWTWAGVESVEGGGGGQVSGKVVEPVSLTRRSGDERMVVFGGMNFTAEATLSGLWEWAPLGGGESTARQDGSAVGSGAGGPIAGAWRAVNTEGISPQGRTGHTMHAVPPPIVLAPHPSGNASLDDAAGPPAPIVTLGNILGADTRESIIVLFGGSTPDDGPLNDTWLLRARAPPGPLTGGAPSYEWEHVAFKGTPPAPRELHAAFVRPAIVRLVAAAPGTGAGAGEVGATRVRVLAPPALVVHGGRCEDGSPRPDLCVLDLATRTWLQQTRAPHARCAAAAAPTPCGLRLLQYGGQASLAELARGAIELDTSGATLEAEGMDADEAKGLRPSEWRWRALPAPVAAPLRFAAAAAALPARSGISKGPGACTLVVVGGMTAIEDLAEAILLDVPVDALEA